MSAWRDKRGIVHREGRRSWQVRMRCGAVATYGDRETAGEVDCMACVAAEQEG
jgi:hypothetical protein